MHSAGQLICFLETHTFPQSAESNLIVFGESEAAIGGLSRPHIFTSTPRLPSNRRRALVSSMCQTYIISTTIGYSAVTLQCLSHPLSCLPFYRYFTRRYCLNSRCCAGAWSQSTLVQLTTVLNFLSYGTLTLDAFRGGV